MTVNVSRTPGASGMEARGRRRLSLAELIRRRKRLDGEVGEALSRALAGERVQIPMPSDDDFFADCPEPHRARKRRLIRAILKRVEADGRFRWLRHPDAGLTLYVKARFRGESDDSATEVRFEPR